MLTINTLELPAAKQGEFNRAIHTIMEILRNVNTRADFAMYKKDDDYMISVFDRKTGKEMYHYTDAKYPFV